MKIAFCPGFFILFLSVFLLTGVQAQDSSSLGKKIARGAKKTGNAVAKGAKKVGAKTAEIASKGKAGVVDKVYEGKEGRNGQKIYIDDNSRYYWIDKKGHRRFVTKAMIRDKKA